MSTLSIAHKTFLEAVLGMQGGHVLDFTNTTFAQSFDHIQIDIYNEKYAEYGPSKANRLRALWQMGDDSEVAAALTMFADYIEAKKLINDLKENVSETQIARIRSIAQELIPDTLANPGESEPIAVSTEATVTNDKISIKIHEDIYAHINPYLVTHDYFHAIEESYKLVREKLRELTGKEKASDVFNNSAQNNAHYEALFGRAEPRDAVEADFFRGVAYLHLGVQHLRNEKAHTPATQLEPNLAIHYISLASLAYDLINRHVTDQTIQEIESSVRDKWKSYRSATSFYRDFKGGKWLADLPLPASYNSASVRNVLKTKWLADTDFTRSYDHSNLMFMQLELVSSELTASDMDKILDLPSRDRHGNDQQAGLEEFLEYIMNKRPDIFSPKAQRRIDALRTS